MLYLNGIDVICIYSAKVRVIFYYSILVELGEPYSFSVMYILGSSRVIGIIANWLVLRISFSYLRKKEKLLNCLAFNILKGITGIVTQRKKYILTMMLVNYNKTLRLIIIYNNEINFNNSASDIKEWKRMYKT